MDDLRKLKFSQSQALEIQPLEATKKTRINNFKKYGVESTNQLAIVKLKKNHTLFGHFSDGYKDKSIIDKRKETCMKKYGVDNIMKLKKAQDKRAETISKFFDQNRVFDQP